MNSFRFRRENTALCKFPTFKLFPRVILVLAALSGYRAICALERLLFLEVSALLYTGRLNCLPCMIFVQ